MNEDSPLQFCIHGRGLILAVARQKLLVSCSIFFQDQDELDTLKDGLDTFKGGLDTLKGGLNSLKDGVDTLRPQVVTVGLFHQCSGFPQSETTHVLAALLHRDGFLVSFKCFLGLL